MQPWPRRNAASKWPWARISVFSQRRKVAWKALRVYWTSNSFEDPREGCHYEPEIPHRPRKPSCMRRKQAWILAESDRCLDKLWQKNWRNKDQVAWDASTEYQCLQRRSVLPQDMTRGKALKGDPSKVRNSKICELSWLYRHVLQSEASFSQQNRERHALWWSQDRRTWHRRAIPSVESYMLYRSPVAWTQVSMAHPLDSR